MIAIFYELPRCDLHAKEQEQKKGNKEQQQNDVVCKSPSAHHRLQIVTCKSSSVRHDLLSIVYVVNTSSSISHHQQFTICEPSPTRHRHRKPLAAPPLIPPPLIPLPPPIPPHSNA